MLHLKLVAAFLFFQRQEVQQFLHILSIAETLKQRALVLLQLLQRSHKLGLLALICIFQQLPAREVSKIHFSARQKQSRNVMDFFQPLASLNIVEPLFSAHPTNKATAFSEEG